MSVIIECNSVWKKFGKPAAGIKELLIGKKSGFSKYAREWALQDVNFQVERGTSFGIVGHNGTGKSTLLSLLLGTILPDRGNISVKGRVSSLLELGAGFHPDLTGRENIFLYASISGMRLADINKNLQSIIDFSELESAIDNPIRTYSSGMVARLGFSTIIHLPVDILLIDEVLAVGDSKFQEKCKTFLKDFKKNNGTLVIVSHEMETLLEMCDVGVCMNLGKVVQYGDIKSVVAQYKSIMKSGTQKAAQ